MDNTNQGVSEMEEPISAENPTANNQTGSAEDQQDDAENTSQNQAFAAMRTKLTAAERKLAQYESDESLLDAARTVPASQPRDDIEEEVERPNDTNTQIEELNVRLDFPEYQTDSLFRKRVAEKYAARVLVAQQQGRRMPSMVDAARDAKAELDELRGGATSEAESKAIATEANKETANAESVGTRIQSSNNGSGEIEERYRRINRGDSDALTQVIVDEVLTEEDIKKLDL